MPSNAGTVFSVPAQLVWLSGAILSLSHAAVVAGIPCQHIPPKSNNVARGILLDRTHGITRRSQDQPLRIHLSYDDSISSLPSSTKSILEDRILLPAVGYWSATLSVPSSTSPIKLLQSCVDGKLAYIPSDPQPYCQNGCTSVTMCGEVVVPAAHLAACRSLANREVSSATPDGGVGDSDFIMYVASLHTDRCDGPAVAYASYCQLEAELDRPVAGYVNICPKEFSLDVSKQVDVLASVIKHEILHAIGFSYGLFAFYRDQNGRPLTPRGIGNWPPLGNDGMYQYSDRVAKVVQRSAWLQKSGFTRWNVTMVVTPKVQAEVRQHFNCSTLEGAELENQGSLGTQLTHWEKRVFENELMTGIYTQLPAVSRITLALLEDTGWYRANYDKAEPLEWGANLGCDFVQNSCLHWMLSKQQQGKSIHPFCNRAPDVAETGAQAGTVKTVTECDVNRHSKTLCNLQAYGTPLPAAYQYFPNASLGGYVELADYCPYIQIFNYKQSGVAVRDSRCLLPSNQPGENTNFGAETYSSASRCFEQQVPFVVSRCKSGGGSSVALTYGSGCYEYECSADGGLAIFVLGTKYRCYYAGQNITVTVASSSGFRHEGIIMCPPCRSICQQEGQPMCPPDQQPLSSNESAKDVCSLISAAPKLSTLPTSLLRVFVAAVAAIRCTDFRVPGT